MIPAYQIYSHHVKLQAESGNHCGSKSKSMTPRTTLGALRRNRFASTSAVAPVAIFSLFLALVNQRQFRGANEVRVAFYVGDRTVVSIIEEP
jgi:ABC-type sugar transport system permease subunit